jgi:hypothetical protein
VPCPAAPRDSLTALAWSGGRSSFRGRLAIAAIAASRTRLRFGTAPCSMFASEASEHPARAASSTRVRPAASRASHKSSPAELVLFVVVIGQVSASSDQLVPKFGKREHGAAQELRRTEPDRWKRSVVERYLADLLQVMGPAARVVSVDDARLLNDVPAVGPGLAACESCRAVFSVKRRRTLPAENRRKTWCPACIREDANRLKAFRRRSARAWWRDDEVELCIGCTHITPPKATPVKLGQLYCSRACRRRIERYIERGGSIKAPRAGHNPPWNVIELG